MKKGVPGIIDGSVLQNEIEKRRNSKRIYKECISIRLGSLATKKTDKRCLKEEKENLGSATKN